jgi:hypothetical protein
MCFDSLGTFLAFALVGFTFVGISLESFLIKLNVPRAIRTPIAVSAGLLVLSPFLLWQFYLPFLGVGVGRDRIELRYLWPRPSETVMFSEISSVDSKSMMHAAKQVRYSTACLELKLKNDQVLRSMEIRGGGSGTTEDPLTKAQRLIKVVPKPLADDRY